MDFIKGFIHTLGLDSSFFIQLTLAVILYFLVTRTALKPYLQLLEKRQNLTKGRFDNSHNMETRITQLKAQYEEQTKKVHKAFQKHFGTIKTQVEQSYKANLEQLQKEQEQRLRSERERVVKESQEQMALLKSDLPRFVALLAEKLKGVSS